MRRGLPAPSCLELHKLVVKREGAQPKLSRRAHPREGNGAQKHLPVRFVGFNSG